MNKNIIFIHLESINNLSFKMQPQLFPNLYKIIDEGIYFQNYFSSATSTLMVITDLMYGNMYRNESSINMKDGYVETYKMNSFFDYLKDRYGYRTGVILWPVTCEQEKFVSRKIVGEKIEHIPLNNSKRFKDMINKFLETSDSFALFVADFATHIEYQKHTKRRNASMTVRWKDTRREMDELCGELMKILKQRGKINDTIIVFYGDHGDDFWGRKLNNGYTHATEPYTNIISTPLIMYIPGYNGLHVRKEIISTIDLKDIVLNTLNVGIDDSLNVKNRTYIFSRNLYAGQKTNRLSIVKGYSVANEGYLLMVTCKGLELYNNILDPQNTCNILEFFKMNKKGNIVFNLKFKNLRSTHFLSYFRKVEINDIIEQYQILRNALMKEVYKIYNKARLKEDLISQELAFNRIGVRQGYQLYNHKIVKWVENK